MVLNDPIGVGRRSSEALSSRPVVMDRVPFLAMGRRPAHMPLSMRSRAPRFGRTHGHVAVAIDSDDLACQRARGPEKVSEPATSARWADDRVRVRARLDAIPLTYPLFEKRCERTLTEICPLVEWAPHPLSGGCTLSLARITAHRVHAAWRSGGVRAVSTRVPPRAHGLHPADDVSAPAHATTHVICRQWRKLVIVSVSLSVTAAELPVAGSNEPTRVRAK
jgi:hypothetical protein